MPCFKELGSVLKKARVASGLSQKELADMVGVTSSQYTSNWERALCAPPSNKLPEVAKVLKIKPETLIDAMLADAKVDIEKYVYPKMKKKKN